MTVKFGVIGCGSISRGRHLPELAANPDARIVAVVDTVESRVEEYAAKYKAKAYTDHRRMLKEEKLDAVVVCTPNALHASQSIDAFQAGKHVLCEKPLATSRPDAKAMIAAAEKAGKFLMIGHNQRLMSEHVKAKEVLDSGRLGKVLAFRTAFQHAGPENYSIEVSSFFDKDLAVLGVCADLGIHKVDLLRYLLGEEFVEVGGIVSTLEKKDAAGKPIATDDNAFLTLKTKSGVIGSLLASWTNYGDSSHNHTVIYGTEAVLMLASDPEFGVIVNYRDPKKVSEKFKTAGPMGAHQTTSSGVSAAFVQSILKNQPPTINGMEGYRSLNVILTAMEAAREGKTLKIPVE